MLLHLVDVSEAAERDPAVAWETLEDELRRYSPELHAKPRMTVASKCFEDDGWEERLEALRGVAGPDVLGMSSILGDGVKEVLRGAHRVVRGLDEV